jgi:hypothetical protein
VCGCVCVGVCVCVERPSMLQKLLGQCNKHKEHSRQSHITEARGWLFNRNVGQCDVAPRPSPWLCVFVCLCVCVRLVLHELKTHTHTHTHTLQGNRTMKRTHTQLCSRGSRVPLGMQHFSYSYSPQISEQYSWWCAGFCLQPPDSHWKAALFLFSRWDVVCLCIHWMVQNTKHPFLIRAGSVYNIYVLFSCC